MASSGGGARRKEQPLVDLSDIGQSPVQEARDSLTSGDVDLQEWERRLAAGLSFLLFKFNAM